MPNAASLKRILRDKRTLVGIGLLYIGGAWFLMGLWFTAFSGGLLLLAVATLVALRRNRGSQPISLVLATVGVASVAFGVALGTIPGLLLPLTPNPAVIANPGGIGLPLPTEEKPTTTVTPTASPTPVLPIEEVSPVEDAHTDDGEPAQPPVPAPIAPQVPDAPVEAPVEPDPAPFDPAPVDPAPIDPLPVETSPVDQAPGSPSTSGPTAEPTLTATQPVTE